MKISKGVSEKITLKNAQDQYHSREFSAYREVNVPDNSPPDLVRLEEVRLDYELRKQVLTSFVLEAVITADQMQKSLVPYKALLDAAQEAVDALINNVM